MRKVLSILLVSLVMILVLAACGGDGGSSDEASVASTGDPVHGEELYNQVCIACHGEGGVGMENLGKPFTTSEFVASQSEEELLAFVKTGRPIGDPANTTGVDMPPKGGNPALTDEQILDIIAYIRTLQE